MKRAILGQRFARSSMRIANLQLSGIRCFDDTGLIKLSNQCNIFVGQNNSGKSTLLRAVLSLQGFSFSNEDIRPDSENSFVRVRVADALPNDALHVRPGGAATSDFIVDRVFLGSAPSTAAPNARINNSQSLFSNLRPTHAIVPFVAKRKSPGYEQSVATAAQQAVTGTYQHLVARVDTLATAGHPRHDKFIQAVRDIVGIPITTKAAANGKETGFYLDDNNFVSLERMGDGVTELVAHIVELVLEDRKIFVLEEPESFLHPRALRSLLALIREASARNQFLIATHSNIVIRELSGDKTHIFRVSRTSGEAMAPSIVERVPDTPMAHRDILRELGYGFADFDLHEGWLFLEEASAESVFREILIPFFVPALSGKLRTFSSAGASNLEPSVSEFTRLIAFVHLQPVYRDRLWVRADNDNIGKDAVAKLRAKFEYLKDDDRCQTFSKPAIEHYFPKLFEGKVVDALAVTEKAARMKAKAALVHEIIAWSKADPELAKAEWQNSATELVELLVGIAGVLEAS